MGNIKQGALGGFSGKAGSLIGYQVRGKSFIKGLPRKYRKAPSEAQLASRARFKMLQNWRTPFNGLFAITFRNHTHLHSAQNAAHKHNQAMVQGVYPDYYLEPANLCLSMGTLPHLTELEMHQGENRKLTFSWVLDILADARPSDYVGILVWFEEENFYKAETSIARRGDLTFDYMISQNPRFKSAHVYISVFCEDWTNASTTAYMGKLEL